jgi:cell division septum initiation protein DivIVA
MKHYTKEEVAAMLEKAAAEIERLQIENQHLKAQLEKSASIASTNITKTASSEAGLTWDDVNSMHDELGTPSSVNAYKSSAEEDLVNFLLNV